MVREQGRSDKPSGPLKVAFASPEGVVGVVTEVNVVFDRPVHALGVTTDGPAPFRITPEVPGRFRWVGSRAAVFTSERRLPFATAFKVEVPAGTVAQDGTRLSEPYRFEFETPRPFLVRTWPSAGMRGIALEPEVEIVTDQVVTVEQLKAAATLEVVTGKTSRAVAFDVKKDEKAARTLRLKPKRLLPPHATVTLTLAESLRGTEGPLSTGVAQHVTFNTYDPLALLPVSCGRNHDSDPCAIESSAALQFNNPVKARDVVSKFHVTPALPVKLFQSNEDADTWTSYVPLTARFDAGQSYTLSIDAGLVDQFGQSLQKAASQKITFTDFRPGVEIGAKGRNFAGRALSVPVASRNVPKFDLLTAALSPQDLLAWRDSVSQGDRNELEWLRAFKGVTIKDVRTRVPRNRIDQLNVDAQGVLGASGRGALAIGVDYGQRTDEWYSTPAVQVLNVSELAISAKLSRFGSLVWVTERGTNGAVAGAEVQLVMPQRPVRTFTTDADGLARIPAGDYAPNLEANAPEARAILVARRGNDSVFAPVAEFLEGYRLDVPTDFSGKLSPYGVLFTERGIYRPGDEVWLKGIVRLETVTGNALPGEKPVKVTLSTPAGEEVSQVSTILTSYGTFATKLRIPPGGELGTYYAAVSGLDHERFLQEQLEVSEYRPVELRVAAGTDKPAYVRGDSAKLDVKADYLFGAAAAGLSTSLSVSREPTWFAVPGADDYTVSADAYYRDQSEVSAAGELRRETRQLDAQGRVAWDEKLALPGQRGTELLRIDAEVTDVSRRSVATTGSALLHPALFYVGLKSDVSFVEAPNAVKPQVLAFFSDGKRVAGKRVGLTLVERRFSYAKEGSGDDYHYVGKVIDRELTSCDVTTGAEATSCALNVPHAGYYVVRARSKDDRGNVAESAYGLYASGPGEPTWQDSERKTLTLVLDKKSYAVGQRARVLVKSPYKEAEALITVERSGVYQSYHRVLRGTAPTFEVPVTNELLPNAFIGVHLLPRRSGKGTPLDAASYRIGYASLVVEGEARRLSLQVASNKADFRPGENIDVKVSVKDARGALAPNTEVTLYAADEGVLSLINYRTPDPLQTFARPRPLQVATVESRDAEGRILLEALGGADKGRDGGGGGEGEARRDFRQTSYFNPRLITDAHGEAKVSFKLPETLTTHRLMAVAVSQGDRYGFGQARVTTSKPLMARPSLPRFVRAGDSFEAGVIVSKKGVAAGKVKVKATFTGLVASGALERELDVPENGSLEARFAVQAPHPGKAELRFEVSGNAEKDTVIQPLNIALPMTPEAAAVYGQTDAAQTEKLGDLSGLRDDAGGLSVTLASTALVGLDQTALDLIDYPYSCTEQLSSRIIPLVALGELSKALGIPLPPDARKRATEAVNEIVARQRGDGYFMMWPESSLAADWVTPYASIALARASRAGIPVSKSVLELTRHALMDMAQVDPKDAWDLPLVVMATDALGELGFPDAGSVNRLFARRKELPLAAKALLLHAAVGAKLANDVPVVLTRELEAVLHINGDRALIPADTDDRYHWFWESTARTQALVLRALAARGKQPMLTPLARGLMGLRERGKFRTTQEGAWALLALDDYRRVAEPEPPAFAATLSLGNERLAGASFKAAPPLSQRFELPMSKVLQHGRDALLFEKNGGGSLFYEARLRYVRQKLPTEPIDAGFYVEKSLHSVKPENLGKVGAGAPAGVARELAAGDLVLVDLTVVVPAKRQFVVLDDPLPAGLEAVDPKLMTSADYLRAAGVVDEGDCTECDHGRSGEQKEMRPSYDRSEVRDDRVVFFADNLDAGLFHYRYLARATTFGHFVLPPTKVEEMYEPEVFGRTGATEVTVR